MAPSLVCASGSARSHDLLSTELLKLVPGLRAVRIQLQRSFEILDRALSVALGVSGLRHRLMCPRRLRVVLQIGLQICDCVVEILRRDRALRDRQESVLAEVVLLSALVLRPKLLEFRQTGRAAARRGVGDHIGDRPGNRETVMA